MAGSWYLPILWRIWIRQSQSGLGSLSGTTACGFGRSSDGEQRVPREFRFWQCGALNIRVGSKRPLQKLCLEPAGRLAFRVSDAGRRLKVVDARTGGLRTLLYGDLSFGGLWALEVNAQKQTDLISDGPFFGSLKGRSNSDGPGLAVACLLLGGRKSDVTLPESVSAFGHAGYEPCRITACCSRMRRAPAGHEVGNDAPGSR
jgi:hypothetical protein